MKALFIILCSLFMFSTSWADLAECKKAYKTVKKTCGADVKCAIQALEVAGHDIVYTASSVNCRGDKDTAANGGGDTSPFQIKDRNKKDGLKKKPIKIEAKDWE